MRYGVPCKGSKNQIVKWVIDNLPARETFVDLFAGGCSITHGALLSGKYKRFIVNDINDTPQLFLDAIAGKYKNEKRWIDRESFHKLKGTDRYIAQCWSFGNNARSYLYSKEIEPWKKAVHYARVLGDNSLLKKMGIDSDGSTLDIKEHCQEYARKYSEWYSKEAGATKHLYSPQSLESLQRLQSLESLQRLQRLQSLQRLQRLQSLQRLQRLQSLESDYRAVHIPANSIVYCDIPYKGTEGYNHSSFDHDSFYDWCSQQKELVVVSEYSVPEDRFIKVAQKEKRSLVGGSDKRYKQAMMMEGLWIPAHQKELWQKVVRREYGINTEAGTFLPEYS